MYAAVAIPSAKRETAETAIRATVAHSVVSTTLRDAVCTSVSVSRALSSAAVACPRSFTPKMYSGELLPDYTFKVIKIQS